MFQNVGGQLIDVRVIPIPVRADCTVRIFGIPHDLSRAEAEKIGHVITALAVSSDEVAAQDAGESCPMCCGPVDDDGMALAQGIDTRSAIDAKRRGPKCESPVAATSGDAPEPKSNPHIQEVGE